MSPGGWESNRCHLKYMPWLFVVHSLTLFVSHGLTSVCAADVDGKTVRLVPHCLRAVSGSRDVQFMLASISPSQVSDSIYS